VKRSEIGGRKDFEGTLLWREQKFFIGKVWGNKSLGESLRETLCFHFEGMKTTHASKNDIMYKAAFLNVFF